MSRLDSRVRLHRPSSRARLPPDALTVAYLAVTATHRKPRQGRSPCPEVRRTTSRCATIGRQRATKGSEATVTTPARKGEAEHAARGDAPEVWSRFRHARDTRVAESRESSRVRYSEGKSILDLAPFPLAGLRYAIRAASVVHRAMIRSSSASFERARRERLSSARARARACICCQNNRDERCSSPRIHYSSHEATGLPSRDRSARLRAFPLLGGALRIANPAYTPSAQGRATLPVLTCRVRACLHACVRVCVCMRV